MDYREKAFAVLKERRDRAEERATRLKQSLLADPEYRALDSECKKLAFEKARLASLDRDIGDLNANYEELCGKRAARLKALGHTPEDLKPRYHCAECSDTGSVGGRDCKCLKELVYLLINEGQQVPCSAEGFLENPSLDAVEPERRAAYGKLYALLARYAANFPDVKHIYMLIGAVGVGKSWAAGAVCHALMRRGLGVLFMPAGRLNELFLQYHLAPLDKKQAIFAPLLEADLLVVDDLGSEPVFNNVTSVYLYDLLCERHRPIMITSNLETEELRLRYGDRIFSRLIDAENSRILVIEGSDLRLKKR